MKIELKSIKHYPGMSEETEAFTANLFINDKKAGTAKNEGHGGSTYYMGDSLAGRELILQAEAWCKKLPAEKVPARHGMPAFSIDMNLEHYIDNLLTEHLQQKQVDRYAKKGIVFAAPTGDIMLQKFSVPFADILSHPNARKIIVDCLVKGVKDELKNGVKVLNTNIPESYLKDAGLSGDQYVSPKVPDPVQDLSRDAGQSRSR